MKQCFLEYIFHNMYQTLYNSFFSSVREYIDCINVFKTEEKQIMNENLILLIGIFFVPHLTDCGSHHVYCHMHVLFTCEPLDVRDGSEKKFL